MENDDDDEIQKKSNTLIYVFVFLLIGGAAVYYFLVIRPKKLVSTSSPGSPGSTGSTGSPGSTGSTGNASTNIINAANDLTTINNTLNTILNNIDDITKKVNSTTTDFVLLNKQFTLANDILSLLSKNSSDADTVKDKLPKQNILSQQSSDTKTSYDNAITTYNTITKTIKTIKEQTNNTITKINDIIYGTDIEANQNIKSICEKLITPTGFLVPSNINFNGPAKTKDTELMPIGSIIAFAGKIIPAGWNLCDGSPISNNPILTGILGTANYPDLRGRVIVSSHGKFAFNSKGGKENHQLTDLETPSHKHNIDSDPTKPITHRHGYRQTTGSGNLCSENNCGTNCKRTYAGSNTSANSSYDGDHEHIMNPIGGGQAHNNMQPFLVTNYIIRTK